MAVDSNSKQRIPELFLEIMKVDDEISGLVHETVVYWKDVQRVNKLRERKAELRQAAEIALQWNHNKGNLK